MSEPQWLIWAKQLQALAQTGLAFSQDPFDQERYEMIQQIAAEIITTHSDLTMAFVQMLWSQEQGYATPKVGVRGAAFREIAGVPHVLLVLERADMLWTLPGGFADVGRCAYHSYYTRGAGGGWF